MVSCLLGCIFSWDVVGRERGGTSVGTDGWLVAGLCVCMCDHLEGLELVVRGGCRVVFAECARVRTNDDECCYGLATR